MSMHPRATEILGLDFLHGVPGAERRGSAQKTLEAMPVLSDIAKGGDIPFCADMLVAILDSTLIHMLDRLVQVNEHVSSRAITAFLALELARGLEAQMDVLGHELAGPCAALGAVAVSELPPEARERAMRRSRDHVLAMFEDMVRRG